MIQSKGGESIKGASIKDCGADRARVPRRRDGRHRRARPTSSASASPTARCPVTDVNPRFGGAFPLPLAAGSRYPELALALANGERPEPTLGEFRAGVLMTRFFSHLCLTAGTAVASFRSRKSSQNRSQASPARRDPPHRGRTWPSWAWRRHAAATTEEAAPPATTAPYTAPADPPEAQGAARRRRRSRGSRASSSPSSTATRTARPRRARRHRHAGGLREHARPRVGEDQAPHGAPGSRLEARVRARGPCACPSSSAAR